MKTIFKPSALVAMVKGNISYKCFQVGESGLSAMYVVEMGVCGIIKGISRQYSKPGKTQLHMIVMSNGKIGEKMMAEFKEVRPLEELIPNKLVRARFERLKMKVASQVCDLYSHMFGEGGDFNDDEISHHLIEVLNWGADMFETRMNTLTEIAQNSSKEIDAKLE
jgi:hypothetical protein